MPRYYFHVVSPRNPVRDAHGVELAGLDAAHWHAMHLVYRLREHAPETGEDWVIEVSDETGARPLVVLPRAVPMLREATKPAELGGSLSNLGGDPGEGNRGTRQQSRHPPHLSPSMSLHFFRGRTLEPPSPVAQMRAGLSPLRRG